MRLVLLGFVAVAIHAQTGQNAASVTGAIRVTPEIGRAVRFRVIAQSDYINLYNTAYGTTPGSYELKQLIPGSYRFLVTLFLDEGRQVETQRSVTLAKGQMLTFDISIPFPRFAEVSGRVIGDDGQGVGGVLVHAMTKRFRSGGLQFSPIREARTDEHGRFHIGGLPVGHSLVFRADGSTTGGRSPADTFWPSTTSPDSAQEIVLAPGELRGGLEIRRITEPSYCVYGLAESGIGFDSMWIEVVRSGMQRDAVMTENQIPASGEALQKFTICGLHNGTYQIGVTTAALKGPPRQFRKSEGRARIHGEDAREIRLGLQLPVTITGETLWDGPAPARSNDAKLFIHFEGTLRMGGGLLGEPGVPAQFSIAPNLLPEDYIIDRVEARGGSRFYVKDWTWNSQHIPGGRVSMGGDGGGGHIRVLVGSDGAVINVSVSDSKDHPEANAFVALVPASPADEFEITTKSLCGDADQNGNVRFDAVPPGRYRSVAFSLESGSGDQVGWGRCTDLSANLVAKLRAAGAGDAVVHVSPNSKLDLGVKVRLQ